MLLSAGTSAHVTHCCGRARLGAEGDAWFPRSHSTFSYKEPHLPTRPVCIKRHSVLDQGRNFVVVKHRKTSISFSVEVTRPYGEIKGFKNKIHRSGEGLVVKSAWCTIRRTGVWILAPTRQARHPLQACNFNFERSRSRTTAGASHCQPCQQNTSPLSPRARERPCLKGGIGRESMEGGRHLMFSSDLCMLD